MNPIEQIEALIKKAEETNDIYCPQDDGAVEEWQSWEWLELIENAKKAVEEIKPRLESINH